MNKKYALLGVSLFLMIFTSCGKDELATSVKGSIYDTAGVLATEDTFYVHIYSGNPNGGWGAFFGVNEVEEIACLSVYNGKYHHFFKAEESDYLWMRIFKKNALQYSRGDHLGYYEIYPGEDQIRDVIQEPLTWLKIKLYNKGRFENLSRIYIDPYSLSRHSGSFLLYADSISFPYELYLSGGRSTPYHLSIGVRTDEFHQAYFYQNNFPNADTTILNFDL